MRLVSSLRVGKSLRLGYIFRIGFLVLVFRSRFVCLGCCRF